jgi:hypothetical protein
MQWLVWALMTIYAMVVTVGAGNHHIAEVANDVARMVSYGYAAIALLALFRTRAAGPVELIVLQIPAVLICGVMWSIGTDDHLGTMAEAFSWMIASAFFYGAVAAIARQAVFAVMEFFLNMVRIITGRNFK